TTEVVAVPTQGRPADYRGAVGHYEIITRATPTKVKAGDPITLNIGIRGDGPMDLVQSPPLAELPALAQNFKVPDEALAGVVQDDIKVFSVTVRPKQEGITEIPAIPLSYFDPDRDEFVTVHSAPIAVHVDPADNLSLASIVSANGPAERTESDETETQSSILSFTNGEGSQLLTSATPRSVWPLVIGLLAAPLLLTGVLLVRYRERVLKGIGGSRTAIHRRAQHALQAAQSAEQVSGALLTYIAERLGLSSDSLTRGDAMAALDQNGMCSEGLDSLLIECETSCYAGTGNADVDSLTERGEACLSDLHRKRSPASNQEDRHWIASGVKATTAALLLAAGLFLGGQNTMAAELAPVQAEQILQEATVAYRQGQAASTDAATAKESFATAAEKYQTLVDDGVDNGKLYHSLANAYLQSGDLGRAVANYERAAGLLPGDPSIAVSQAYVKSLLGSDGQAPTAWERIEFMNNSLSVDTRIALGLVCWSLVWAALAGTMLWTAIRWRYVLIPAAMGFVLCASSLGIQWWQAPQPERGIVVANQALLREGNGEGFAATGEATLGTDLEVIQRRGEWLEVCPANGRSGWLLEKDVEVIPSRDWRAT
ncbi:MAG: BatD family protein, partial [Planctomycetales bacterium]